MKMLLLFLSIFQWIFVDGSNAQTVPFSLSLDKYKTVDTCVYKAYYKMKFYYTPGNEKSVVNDVRVLEIGKHSMKGYSYLLYHYDSIATDCKAKGIDTAPICQESTFPVETILNLKNKSTILIYRTFFDGPVLRYTEPTEEIKWQILDKTDTIMSYPCQEATCQFRGRTYTAWFTTDIPFSYGPYKFHGLPGLILKISDSNNEYSWQCVKFVKAKPKETIKNYKWDGYDHITTRENIVAILKRAYAAPFKFCQSFGMKIMLSHSDGSASPATHDITLPYNPIEK